MSSPVPSSYRRWRIGVAIGVLGTLALVMAPTMGRADEDDQGRRGRDKAEPANTDIEKLEAKLAKQKADLEDTALKLKAALEAAKSARETPKAPEGRGRGETPKGPDATKPAEGRGRGEAPKTPDTPAPEGRGRGFGPGFGGPGGPGGFGRGGFGGGPGGSGERGARGTPSGGKSVDDIEKRLDAMIEELQQLRKDLKSATPAAPEGGRGNRPGPGGDRGERPGPGGERPGRGERPSPDDAPAPPRGR